jgi:outer membrane protein TolC
MFFNQIQLLFSVIFVILVSGSGLNAQSRMPLSLDEAIRSAQDQSSVHKLAQTQKTIGFYQYMIDKSNSRPQISFLGNAPVYSKQFTPVTQPDGSIQFLPVEQNTTYVDFSLSQAILATGGQISLNTGLTHFYDFRAKYNQFNGTPVFIQLDQPINGFNELKWQKKIAPLKLEESKRSYVQTMEDIAQQTNKLYFDALDAQSNILIAKSNLKNAMENYSIEVRRINLGTTTEDKLLQLKLQTLKTEQDLKNAMYQFKISELNLTTYMGYKDTVDFELSVPEQLTLVTVDVTQALLCARKYRSDYIAFERKKMEAQRDIAQAKSAGQEIKLVATFGYNRAADHLAEVYTDPKNQQTLSIGFNIPIVDWGRRKARYGMAAEQEKLVIYNNELDEAGIVKSITTLVNNIELLKNNISLARLTDSVALKRYTISNKLYQIGKLTVTDLNIAQSEKDEARRNHIAALRNYWDSYYLLRKMTLFDFANQVPLYEGK